MAHGKRVQGQAGYDNDKAAEATKKRRGGLGWRVTGEGKPKEGSFGADRAEAPKAPPAPPVEAYNTIQATEKAKENPFDLPRLLDLELARVDGARKTVLVAYRKQVAAAETPDVAVMAKIDAALEAYAHPAAEPDEEPEVEKPKGGDEEDEEPTT